VDGQARLAVFVGEREVGEGFVTVKHLGSGTQQQHVLPRSQFDAHEAAAVVMQSLS
jgi:histidyl-tRNA synthetase